MQRWIFYDTVTLATWTVPLNPNSMSSPFLDQSTSPGVRSPIDGTMRVRRSPRNAKEWEFAGVVRAQEHHDTLIAWAGKTNLLHITDHYGRKFAVRIRSIDMEDRKPTPNTPWRLRYRVQALSYGVV